jgi:hypothetical protein
MLEKLITRYEECKFYESVVKRKKLAHLKQARQAVRNAAQDIANYSFLVLNRRKSSILKIIDPIVHRFKMKIFLLSLNRIGNPFCADEMSIILGHYFK